MSLPLVSIITPSFNQDQYLQETIESVLSQKYVNIEYIIIDGGSEDNSLNIIKKYQKHLKYWISEKDNGQADAINKGLLKCSGDLISWINSDDIIYPDFIQSRVKQFTANPEVVFIYGDVEQGPDSEHKRIRKGKQTTFLKMLKTLEVPIPQQSAVWKRAVFQKCGLLNKNWNVLLDREYFLRIARYFNITYFSDPVAFFRNHVFSKSIKDEKMWAEEIPKLYDEVLIKNIYSLDKQFLNKNNNRLLSKAHLFSSAIYEKNDQLDLASKHEEIAKNLSPILSRYFIFKEQIKKSILKFKKVILCKCVK